MPMAKPISGETYLLPISINPPILGANTVLAVTKELALSSYSGQGHRSSPQCNLHFTQTIHHHTHQASDNAIAQKEADRSSI